MSESVLWSYQASYFSQRGVRAWNEAEVPHFVTSNPWIATSYARVVLGWLRDWHAAGGLDPAHPLYIVELGCGNGRFGYLLVRKMLELVAATPFAGIDVKYVFTDSADYNLDVLRSHALIQPLVDAGVVDFALFDASTSRELRLREGGEILAPGTIRNPMAVMANYVFDGIPQDCFRLHSGRLHEGRARLTSERAPADREPADAIASVGLTFDYAPIVTGCYEDPEWNRILATYDALPGDATFLFPCAALACVKNLAELSGDRLLLISADKGHASFESLAGRAEVSLNVHGSFSLPVNYHAIGEYITGRGGQFLTTSHLDTSLAIVAGLLGEPGGGYPEARLAYDECIETQAPDDFHTLKKVLTGVYERGTLEQLIAILRFSGWDHTVFLHCVEALCRCIATADAAERSTIASALDNVWEHHFPLREPGNVALHIGRLFLYLEQYRDALVYARRALSLESGNQAAHALVSAIERASGSHVPD